MPIHYLTIPDTKPTQFAGYGLHIGVGYLRGLIMVDRPSPVSDEWIEKVRETYGEAQLVPMARKRTDAQLVVPRTFNGVFDYERFLESAKLPDEAYDRGLVANLYVASDSLQYVRCLPTPLNGILEEHLYPLYKNPPKPDLRVRYDPDSRLWLSELI